MWRALRLMPRTFPYLRRYKVLGGGVGLLTVLGSLIALAQPWPLAFLVDSILGTKDFPSWMGWLATGSIGAKIGVAVAAGLLLTLITGGVSILDEYVKTKLSLHMVRDFRSDIFQHMQKLSLTQHEDRNSGQFIFQTTSEADNVPIVVETAPPLAESLLTLVGMFFVVARLNLSLALVTSTIVPFVYHASRWYADHIEEDLIRIRSQEGGVMSIIYESMAMIRVVKAFSRERHHHREFQGQSEAALRSRVKITVKQTMFSLVVSLVTGVGTALALAVGAYLVIGGRLTVGELLVVLAYISAIYRPLESIGTTLGNLQQRTVPLRLGFQVLDTEPDVDDAPEARELQEVEGRVTFDGCSFSYKGRQHTLDNISFDANPGEVIAVVGPTGAGKSTLVSLIPRFLDPDEGRVLVDGHDVREVTQASLRSHIAVVLQDPLLFSGSIMENIRYGRLEATDDEVREAARAANADGFISKLPNGYQTLLGERGARMSGGERQRISIARAFLRDAPILILDEPTSSVDSKTESVILDSLDKLMRGRTTFMIAHRLGTVRKATKILVMEDGRIVERGTHAELLEADGLYRRLHAAQTGEAIAAVEQVAVVTEVPQADHEPPTNGFGRIGSQPGPVEGTSKDGVSIVHGRVVTASGPAMRRAAALRAGGERQESGIPAAPDHPRPPSSASAYRPSNGAIPREGEGPKAGPTVRAHPRIVILGMLTKIPVAGVVWQTLHYMKGFELLGYEPYYVEAHGRTPSMFMKRPEDDGSMRAAHFVASVMRSHGYGQQWAYHARHDGDRHFGLSRGDLRRLYASAELIINLHGGTLPTEELAAGGRLVYLETDPVNIQVEVNSGDKEAIDYIDAHQFHFTFAENIGKPGCRLPKMGARTFKPTRQPVVFSWWADHNEPTGSRYTTVGNWRQQWREVNFGGEIYHWSKHLEFQKVIDLPRMTGVALELALASYNETDLEYLDRHGWIVIPSLGFSLYPDRYRRYIQRSRAEFTVAKDQNVRLRTGWFSDRSATYLAAGRPVVTQDTGFGTVLPTGEGLFSFSSADDAAAAITEIERNYDRHSAAARKVAQQHFGAMGVLQRLLDDIGVERRTPGPHVKGQS